MNKIKIAVVLGKTVTGKSTLAHKIAGWFHLPLVSFGGSIREEYAVYCGTATQPMSLQDFGSFLFMQKGPANFIAWVLDKAHVTKQQSFIAEGIRPEAVYNELHSSYEIFTIWCECSYPEQLSRLIQRDGKSHDEAKSYLTHPIECEVERLRKHAFFIFNSEGYSRRQEELLFSALHTFFK